METKKIKNNCVQTQNLKTGITHFRCIGAQAVCLYNPISTRLRFERACPYHKLMATGMECSNETAQRHARWAAGEEDPDMEFDLTQPIHISFSSVAPRSEPVSDDGAPLDFSLRFPVLYKKRIK
jgi:hypothetical protein